VHGDGEEGHDAQDDAGQCDAQGETRRVDGAGEALEEHGDDSFACEDGDNVEKSAGVGELGRN